MNGTVRIRVEDYLNDKIQTATDLSIVDDLLTQVKEQQNLFRKQLAVAKSVLFDAEEIAEQHAGSLRDRATAFQSDQTDIDRRLQIITQSEASSDAVRVFESRMTNLRRLEIAEGYAEILKEVDTLVVNAHKSIESDSRTALASHARARTILHGLHEAQPAAEGAAPHLTDYVAAQTNTLYTEIRTSLERGLQSTLERMAWPGKDLKLVEHIIKEWKAQVEALLELQEPEVNLDLAKEFPSSSPDPVILLPVQVMVRPLAQRFQYHFYGERPTNRLDKPEYFFSHALDLIEQHSQFMNHFLQPVLDKQVRESRNLEMILPDAISALISALIPVVATKCLSLLPNITNQPQLLSHFFHEIMAFDNTLRNDWAYTPVPGMYTDWKGLTWDMLNVHGYFPTWLEVEKDFALNRYKKIRDATESSNIEYEDVETGRSRPTKGAIRVNDLLETITDRYRGLISFSQKMKFLMEIQLAIFDDYHNHLYGALQAYLVGSHTAGRLIQGQTETETSGLKGLETLVKIFGSSEYLERKMSDWSDDIFFLELWEELQDRAKRNTRDGSVGNGLTVEDVAAKTSSTIKQNDNLDDEGGALFDETAASYRRLRERSESEIVRVLEINIRNAIRPLTKASNWSTISSTNSDITAVSSSSSSSALDSLLTTLSALLGFLSKVIAPAPLRRITRQFCQTVQREIHDNLIMRHTFSAAGAAQLRRDVLAIEEVIDTQINVPGESQRAMWKLEESLVLLNLPVKPSSTSSSKQMNITKGEDDNWGFDDVDDGHQEDSHSIENGDTDESTSWGLWQAEKAIFADNESARQALTAMKLDLVSESEARELIRRRLEINS